MDVQRSQDVRATTPVAMADEYNRAGSRTVASLWLILADSCHPDTIAYSQAGRFCSLSFAYCGRLMNFCN